MIHQGSGGFRGNTPDVEIQMREMMHLTDRLMHILADHTGQTFDKVKRDSERDYFMSADEAKTYGLIDEVFVGNTESLISMTQAAGGKMPEAEEAAAGGRQEEVAGQRSRSSSRRLRASLEPQPLQPSAARTTRWHGTAGKSGQRPIAPPTARAAPGRPIAAATSP